LLLIARLVVVDALAAVDKLDSYIVQNVALVIVLLVLLAFKI
jgi:hypothetical protein